MNNEEDGYYEEDEDDEEGFILSFDDEKGTPKITSVKDHENALENQQKIVMMFLKENNNLFIKFLEKKGISEEDFNEGRIKDEGLK